MGATVEHEPEIQINLTRLIAGEISFEPGEEIVNGHYRTGTLKLSTWAATKLSNTLKEAVLNKRTFMPSYVYWQPEA
jgi:hypothetical protein